MRHSHCLLLACAFLLASCGSLQGATVSDPYAGWQTVTSDDPWTTVTFRLPPAWQRIEGSFASAVTFAGAGTERLEIAAERGVSVSSFIERRDTLEQQFNGSVVRAVRQTMPAEVDGRRAVTRLEYSVPASKEFFVTYVLDQGKVYQFTSFRSDAAPLSLQDRMLHKDILGTVRF